MPDLEQGTEEEEEEEEPDSDDSEPEQKNPEMLKKGVYICSARLQDYRYAW
jgi:hypothetical protein